MDVDESYLDLLALRELYILLLKSCLRDAPSELLDERAQILLKNLLDDATAEVLEFLPKNMATDSGIFYKFLHKDDKQSKPLDEKVVEWMKPIPKRARGSASNATTDLILQGISSAIRRIEHHILSLQRYTSQSKRSHISYCGRSVLKGNETSNRQKVQSRTDHSTISARQIKGLLVGGQNAKAVVTPHCSEFVHGFRLPLSQGSKEGRKPLAVETHLSKQHKLVNPMTLIDKCGGSVGSKATIRPRKKPSQSRVKKSQNSYGLMVMKPTLLDHPSREVRKEETQKKTHLATQHESEFTDSACSSSWTTQQTSESGTLDDFSSPSHQDERPANSSETSSIRYSQGKKESKRAIGRFKRLKNKLGIIFHHHHHHHHHNSHSFMWNRVRKIFHPTNNKKLTSMEDRYEKGKNTAIRSECRTNQVGKFQAIAKELRSHVRRSKALTKKDPWEMKCGKKGVKKLHWWKLFRDRHGVRLHNKGRIRRIRYVNKKPQL
ncbi:protein KOKOPELLI-like isoform X1 [Cucurbita moschata]|uniref:Protein KOKOPELLI-like isoform X1 n=2 Tax=Cucurbita moschata TaxID=3662 RepID=A0A6J1ETH9_CUCMO|nr:protein KOKOPELLI-like isoform X1 [Cucurbita moschata]